MMILDVPSELEAVQPTGQVDVREHHADVLTLIEDKDRVIGAGRLDHLKAGLLENIHGEHTNEGFILDHENDRRCCG
jgi:hypothetical protein